MQPIASYITAALICLLAFAAASAESDDAIYTDASGKAWPIVDHPGSGGPSTARRLRPQVDTDSLLRNPATGWILYDDACGEVANAAEYWKAMDEAALKHASIFYLRWRWSDAELKEGRYAWKFDPNFKALIEGAQKRGLRLAFRFYVNSQDNIRQATPDYVRQAGAEGFMENGAGNKPLWTPYHDDPVFQQKLTAFVAAFAKEFDDPKRVDFVDAMGLGWWGEGHHIPLKTPANIDKTLRWILDTYSKPFHHVLLGWQFGTNFGAVKDEWVVIKGEDYLYRRDGLGSAWFSKDEKAACLRLFPRYPLYAERCYWSGDDNVPDAAKQDPEYGPRFKSWRDMDSIAIEDALDHHANTLDLRTIPDVKRFLTYPDLIEKFTRAGGYRLAPVEVECPATGKPGRELVIRHSWINLGVGVLPNYNKRWGQKYRPAFALLAADSGKPIAGNVWIGRDAEPGDWLKGNVYRYLLRAKVAPGTKPGAYKLACAILNTSSDGAPDLELALKSARNRAWRTLGTVMVKP